jgi:hypothetical protein
MSRPFKIKENTPGRENDSWWIILLQALQKDKFPLQQEKAK